VTGRAALFLVDGRWKSGGGHLKRSGVLADALRNCGWTVRTLIHREEDDGDEREDGYLPGEYPYSIECAKFHLAVVDDYEMTAVEESTLRDITGSIAVLEDQPSRKHDCDILIDPTFGRAASDYAPFVSDDCLKLLGTGHALLDPVFAEFRNRTLARRQCGTINQVVVSFGMIDRPNSTRLALEALRQVGRRWQIDVVLSPAYAYRDELGGLMDELGATARTVDTAGEMVQLLSAADLAIGAAGSSAWERCCLGLPSVVFINAANQRDIAASLEQNNAALVCGAAENVSAASVADAILRIADDGTMYRNLSETSANMCDGLGGIRVADAINQWATAR